MGRSIETRIEIAAPAPRVWSVLLDFEAYGTWNPFIRTITGGPTVGERLDVEITPPEGRPMRFRPVVIALEPERRFAWKGSLGIRGLFDGCHQFDLEPAGEGITRLHHHEDFSGLLVPLMWGMMERNTREGFETMNRALKQRCEST